jgi:hypothetical protein
MKNRTVLLIAVAIIAAAPLSKALANPAPNEYGGVDQASLNPICRPAPLFGKGYQLCTAGLGPLDALPLQRVPDLQLAGISFNGIDRAGRERDADEQRTMRLAGISLNAIDRKPRKVHTRESAVAGPIAEDLGEIRLAGLSFNGID